MKSPCRYCGGTPKIVVDVPRMTWCAACSNCAFSTSPLPQQASDTAKDMEERVNRMWNSRNLRIPSGALLRFYDDDHVILDLADGLQLHLFQPIGEEWFAKLNEGRRRHSVLRYPNRASPQEVLDLALRDLGGLWGTRQSASVKEQLAHLQLPAEVTARLTDDGNAVRLDVARSSVVVLRPPGQVTEGWVAAQFFVGGSARIYPCREGVRSLQAAVDDALSALAPQAAHSTVQSVEAAPENVVGHMTPEAPSAIKPRRTWRDRLFPHPPHPLLQDGATVTQAHIRLDWKDRLRLLLGGQPRVTVVQEFDPKRAGHLVSRSVFWVEAS